MPSCLGLYIEENLIKYAKVSKNNADTKVESFGVKFYEHIENAIKQIIEETYSFKIPIAINTTEEWYNEMQIFSLLSKKDMEEAIKTEFENICYEKEINRNIYEERHFYTNSYQGDDKVKVIDIAVPKISIEQRKNQFDNYKISSIVPISVAIANLTKNSVKGTNIVVNIEKETIVTKVANGIVSDIEVIDSGTEEILEKIKQKENSYSKAYEVCKNSTIYVESDKDLQYEENEYLEDIMPTLFKIVSQVRKIIDESVEKIENVYITGTGAIINNIDIYFQDYLRNIHCEILRPSFINNNSKINVKDYMEVNSAIAIAVQALEKNSANINFKDNPKISLQGITTAIGNSMTSDVSNLKIGQSVSNFLTKFNRQFDFLSSICIISVIVYIAGAIFVSKQYENKIAEANQSIEETNARITEIQQYQKKFDTQTSMYKSLIKNIQDVNDANNEDKRYRNTIPNLLNNIMAVVPKNVQILSISNPSDSHIKITARSQQYQQIAHFKTKLATEEIIKEVSSDTGRSEDGYLIVTIEGELP